MEDHHHHIICKTCGDVVELNFCDISDWSQKVMEVVSQGFSPDLSALKG
jgi:Fe2+ or Zn2+ uptake regulation protein